MKPCSTRGVAATAAAKAAASTHALTGEARAGPAVGFDNGATGEG